MPLYNSSPSAASWETAAEASCDARPTPDKRLICRKLRRWICANMLDYGLIVENAVAYASHGVVIHPKWSFEECVPKREFGNEGRENHRHGPNASSPIIGVEPQSPNRLARFSLFEYPTRNHGWEDSHV